MSTAPRPLESFFRGLLGARWTIVGTYALLVPVAAVLALKVPTDGAIERLVVPSDPDYRATRAFQAVFPDPKRGLLIAEAVDPFTPAVLARVAAIEDALAGVTGVRTTSLPGLFARLRPGFRPDAAGAEALRRFASGTDLFRRQGLVGDGFLGIALAFDAQGATERDRMLGAIAGALAPFDKATAPLTGLRRVGAPWVDAHIERETSRANLRYFPLFALFVVALNIGLYRSWRTLGAFVVTLAVCVALTIGAAAVVGWSFTIVSSIVPLTVLVTATATLVYLHARFVEQPQGVPVEEHHVAALADKFVPCTASIAAAMVGFAALAVSGIRPIRDMGIWTATGLAVTWVVCFTLFPALQRLMRTPTQQERRIAVRWFPALVDALIPFSYRWRWVLVPLASVVMVGGAIALFGLPGLVDGMTLETDALDYVDPDEPLARDARRLERAIGGLSPIEVWVATRPGLATDPGFLAGVERFARALESDERVASATGPTALFRFKRYAATGDDRLPDDPGAWASLAADLEGLLLTEPEMRGFVDVATLGSARLTLVVRGSAFEGHEGLARFVQDRWREAAAREPGLAGAEVRIVGDGVLHAKIAHFLVPTLVESFALTGGIIFIAFLIVFRSGAARLMAMIPSVFAILAMFLLMRAMGIPLNVATILIASTVLGASENDQIHFFYHFQERRRTASTEEALRHAMLVAGRAILFATLINAGGFLALALSPLPPMRQFGVASSAAFVLAMVADFTALPASLWIIFRERPDRP